MLLVVNVPAVHAAWKMTPMDVFPYKLPWRCCTYLRRTVHLLLCTTNKLGDTRSSDVGQGRIAGQQLRALWPCCATNAASTTLPRSAQARILGNKGGVSSKNAVQDSSTRRPARATKH
jgi:hypothetical protein